MYKVENNKEYLIEEIQFYDFSIAKMMITFYLIEVMLEAPLCRMELDDQDYFVEEIFNICKDK